MAGQRSTEVVPGMADAIAERMQEFRLGPSDLARLAGVTPVGLMPLRKGYRRNYQNKLKWGVSNALRWPPDAIDRMLAGELPPFDENPGPSTPAAAVEVEELGVAALSGAIDGDPLTPEELAIATDLIRSIRARRRAEGV